MLLATITAGTSNAGVRKKTLILKRTCKLMHAYSEVNPTVWNGMCFQANVHAMDQTLLFPSPSPPSSRLPVNLCSFSSFLTLIGRNGGVSKFLMGSSESMVSGRQLVVQNLGPFESILPSHLNILLIWGDTAPGKLWFAGSDDMAIHKLQSLDSDWDLRAPCKRRLPVWMQWQSDLVINYHAIWTKPKSGNQGEALEKRSVQKWSPCITIIQVKTILFM